MRLLLPSGAKARGVVRCADEPQSLVVCFDRIPSDDDIRKLHDALRRPDPYRFPEPLYAGHDG